jgi:ribosomal subunit interface protein
MHLQIHAKQIDIGAALRSHTEAKLEALVGKYFDRGWSGIVTFSRDGPDFRCESVVHLASGMTLQSSGAAVEAYGALDQSLDRLESRLKRYLGRLKRHHKESASPIETVTAPHYVIKEAEEAETASLDPIIVAELTAEVKLLTVGGAVLQMNLLDLPALLFRHRASGRLNLVYRRADGHIGWVDPPEARRP